MNILMLAPWLPTMRRPMANERQHRFARHLAKDHRLTLACATDHQNPFGAVSALREEFEDLEFAVVPNRWKRLWSVAHLAAGASAEVAYFSSAALRTRLRDRVRTSRYDLAYVASTSMVPYALELPVPMVLDFGNLDSEWWLERSRRFSGIKAKVYETEAARLRNVEILGAHRAIHCLVATQQAAQIVKSFAPRAAVTVIADGVDIDELAVPRRPDAAHRIVFNPCLEHEGEALAAAEFCREVLPSVRTRVASTKLLIGCKRLFRLARNLTDLPGVELSGPTSDLRPLLRRATVAVAPGRHGSETQRGVLEAMAAGVPVITSREGLDGLPVQHGRELYVEESPLGFTERLIDLLHKPALRDVMAAKGRAFVRLNYSTASAAARLTAVMETVLHGAGRNGSAASGNGSGVSA
jgi:glycosyltransferase involved in cell wall biosynthesis